MKPCLDCGEPGPESRCTSCANKHHRENWPEKRRRNKVKLGYTKTWERLSLRARRIQPFCVECGREENLTADHRPIAWYRHENGLPIRLKDIDVVCNGCNNDRGPARPGTPRYEAWEAHCKKLGRIVPEEPWGDGVTGEEGKPRASGTEPVCIALCGKGGVL